MCGGTAGAVLCALLLAASPASAGDQVLQGEFLHLSSRAEPGRTRIRFGATGPALEERARSGADPSLAGATLEVLGDHVFGADEPPVVLPASNWRALGDPPGSRGYRYFDRSGRFGVRKAALRFGMSTTLSVVGGGSAWPYRTSGTPSSVMIRLSIGDEVFCATFHTFARRRRDAVVAGHNSPPNSCQYEPAGE